MKGNLGERFAPAKDQPEGVNFLVGSVSENRKITTAHFAFPSLGVVGH